MSEPIIVESKQAKAARKREQKLIELRGLLEGEKDEDLLKKLKIRIHDLEKAQHQSQQCQPIKKPPPPLPKKQPPPPPPPPKKPPPPPKKQQQPKQKPKKQKNPTEIKLEQMQKTLERLSERLDHTLQQQHQAQLKSSQTLSGPQQPCCNGKGVDSCSIGWQNASEYEYFRLVQNILDNGKFKPNPNGNGTISLFGAQMRFDLRGSTMPLLTTKKVFWRGVVEELLWFIRGSTDSNVLRDRQVHIWDASGSKEFLESSGFKNREQGDLGPVYGFQWRHFGAHYVDKNTDYGRKGFDQLNDIINLIKNDPINRRLILTAWNPKDIPRMAQPPCHCLAQFYVNDGELSCQVYQQSADVGLEVPFSIASYSLLTHMIAHLTDLKPGYLVHTLGDAHIYVSHVDSLKEQSRRNPHAFPRLNIRRKVKNIDDFRYEDIELIGYQPQATIPTDMAV